MRRSNLTIITLAAILFALLILPALVAQESPSLTDDEKSVLRKVATEWVSLGRWCVSKKFGEKAKFCVEKAEAADSSAFGVKTLREQAEKCEDAPKGTDLKTWESEYASACRKIANLYDRLFAAGDDQKDPIVKERFDNYLFVALELSPTDKRWNWTLSAVDAALKVKDFDRASSISERALSIKPPEKIALKFKDAVDSIACDHVVLKSASSHPMKYYFSLPKNFKRTKDKKWHVLVCVDGAGSGFREMGTNYHTKRGNLPYIVVSPCTFSNTNLIEGAMLDRYRKWYTDAVIEEGKKGRLDWDEQGILAIIKDLQANYDAESRVYVTGFSGGGNATYMMIFKHPDLLAGAAPACANFSPRQYAELKGKFTAEDLNLPIHIITGEKDPHREFTGGNKDSPGIEPQTDWAVGLLKELGYPNYKRTIVPGMGHHSAWDQVIDTFKPYWEGGKKRSDKLDY